MERIDKLVKLPTYQTLMETINKAEEGREFCRHDINHSLDVARIGCILNAEENLGIKKAVIYATALLHDIGRAQEYTGGEKHNAAGAKIARELLEAVNFGGDDLKEIVAAIYYHSSQEAAEKKGLRSLSNLLYRADKMSRNCFLCKKYDECYWPDARKNKGLTV